MQGKEERDRSEEVEELNKCVNERRANKRNDAKQTKMKYREKERKTEAEAERGRG